MTIGIYILIILALGYLSVYIRERWLNLKWIKPFTWLGILIHESAHASACVLTGGRVTGFRVTSTEGYVTHYRPKVPVLGPMLTAIAPMIGGLVIMGILNHFWLKTSLTVATINLWDNFVKVLINLNPLTLSGLGLLVIMLNIGVMIGPSVEDLKSIWPLILLSFLVKSESLAKVLALVIALIIVNILLFILILAIKALFNKNKRRLSIRYANH